MAHSSDGRVLSSNFVVDLFVVEARSGRSDVVTLAHFEVLSKVLVTAPPVGVDHAQTLVSADLMHVRVAHVVLLAVDGETAVAVRKSVLVVGLSNPPAPVLDHLLLLVLHHHVKQERLVQVEHQQHPSQTHAVLRVEHVHLPVSVAEGVLHEAGNVLECSPSLSVVTRLLGVCHKLGEVTVGFLSESPALSETATYRPIMSARSLMLGTPNIKPSMPVMRWRK